MMASELIAELTYAIKEHGNQRVYFEHSDGDGEEICCIRIEEFSHMWTDEIGVVHTELMKTINLG